MTPSIKTDRRSWPYAASETVRLRFHLPRRISPPIAALALTLWMQGLAEHAGARLLRLKGLVCIAEAPELPAVLHGIGHVMHAPAWLEAWPSADHRSRIVLIGQGIPPWWPLRLLEAIEGEVLDAQRPPG